MKIIAVDIGNTETSIGIGNYEKWQSFRFTTRAATTSDEWLMMFSSTLPESLRGKKLGSIVCSVVPQVNSDLIQALYDYLDLEPILLGPGVKTGLSVTIDNPKELGSDRIANAVGGVEKVGSPVIIVDTGTATTVDVVNDKNEYVGGMIAPGVKISHDALIENTASLKSVDFLPPDKVIGKNTYDAIQSGIIFGHTSLIEGLIERTIQELGQEPAIILTGGIGGLISKHLNFDVIYDENLTLDGLAKIYQINS